MSETSKSRRRTTTILHRVGFAQPTQCTNMKTFFRRYRGVSTHSSFACNGATRLRSFLLWALHVLWVFLRMSTIVIIMQHETGGVYITAAAEAAAASSGSRKKQQSV